MHQIYLDHSATTPVGPRVVEAMLPFFGGVYGNPSSLHHWGRQARQALEESRGKLARLLNAQPGEIYFVSGGTEADNLALQGIARQQRSRGGHIITTTVEHQAVRRTCAALQKMGFEITYVAVDKYGQVSPDEIRRAIRPDTVLISVIHANNEVGTINPLAEIGAIGRRQRVAVHTDAVQSFGKIPIDVNDLQVDLLSLSGHKIYGPKGIGALYVRKGTAFAQMMFGGSQENKRRPGTENLPAIVGLAAAAQLIHEEMSEDARRIGALRDSLQKHLLQLEGTRLNGHPTERLYNILNLSFSGCDSESLLMALDVEGIAVSSGSACSSGSIEPSHVLRAMGLDARMAASGIRFSLGRQNSTEEINVVVDCIKRAVERIRSR